MKRNIIILAVIITVSLLIAYIIGIGVSSPVFPKMIDSNDWIGFWGSYAGAVIGGIATMIGVSWTIYNGNRNEIKPCLIFREVNNSDIPCGIGVPVQIDGINGNGLVEIAIEIKNVGRGVAKNIILRKEEFGKREFSAIHHFIECDPEYNRVYFSLRSYFDIPALIKPGDEKTIRKFLDQRRTSCFTLTCEDLLGNLYTYKIIIEYNCSLCGTHGDCKVTARLKDWKAEKTNLLL